MKHVLMFFYFHIHTYSQISKTQILSLQSLADNNKGKVSQEEVEYYRRQSEEYLGMYNFIHVYTCLFMIMYTNK
jgi:hypothetical protein